MVKRTNKLLIMVFSLILIGLALGLFFPRLHSGDRISASHARTQARLTTASAALGLYFAQYGALPQGDVSSVIRVLAAKNQESQNPQRTVFYLIKEEEFGPNGTWVDSWGTPIQMIGHDLTNLVFRSWGQNRKDDGGLGDDIVVAVQPYFSKSMKVGGTNNEDSVAKP